MSAHITNPMGDEGTLMMVSANQAQVSGYTDDGDTLPVSAEIIDLDAPSDQGVYPGDNVCLYSPWIVTITMNPLPPAADTLVLSACTSDAGSSPTSEYVQLPAGYGPSMLLASAAHKKAANGGRPARPRQGRRSAAPVAPQALKVATNPSTPTLTLSVPVVTQGSGAQQHTETVSFTLTKSPGYAGILYLLGGAPDSCCKLHMPYPLKPSDVNLSYSIPVPILRYLSVVAVLPKGKVYARKRVHPT